MQHNVGGLRATCHVSFLTFVCSVSCAVVLQPAFFFSCSLMLHTYHQVPVAPLTTSCFRLHRARHSCKERLTHLGAGFLQVLVLGAVIVSFGRTTTVRCMLTTSGFIRAICLLRLGRRLGRRWREECITIRCLSKYLRNIGVWGHSTVNWGRTPIWDLKISSLKQTMDRRKKLDHSKLPYRRF